MKFFDKVKRKAVAIGLAVCSTVSCLAMSAFATDGSSSASSALDTVTSTMTTELTSLVSKGAIAVAGVVGVGLTIFGIKWLVGTLKSFFSRLSK